MSPSRGEALLAALSPTTLAACEGRATILADEPMSRHTTLRLGGPADLWIRPHEIETLSLLLERCHALEIPVTFVGAGTNLLVRDGGIRGAVFNLQKLNRVWQPDAEGEAQVVEVEAGASTGRLLSFCTKLELGGVEFLGGVPGSVGGGLIMNAGTYLGEFTDVVETVTSLQSDGTPVTRVHAECGFRYRDSDLPAEEIVVHARLQLKPRTRAEIDEEVAALRARRKEREPSGVPNNGSTFKNPPGDYAGRLIETAGLKGLRQGGAVVSPKHANWLVVDKAHEPACTAKDLLALIALVQEKVEAVHGVRLEREVKVIGAEG